MNAKVENVWILFILISGLPAFGEGWNDPNRLQLSAVNLRHGHEPNRTKIPLRFHSRRNVVAGHARSSHPHSHRPPRTPSQGGGASVQYGRYAPVVVTASEDRVYAAKVDPASYYPDRPVIITARHYKSDEDRVPYKVTQITSKLNEGRVGGEEKGGESEETMRMEEMKRRKQQHQQQQLRRRKMKARRRSSRGKNYEDNSIPNRTQYRPAKFTKKTACIRCPSEAILVAAKGKERALLVEPTLFDCRGNPAEDARFEALYGPKIGASLKEGIHVTVGTIIMGDKTLQLCQFRNTVIVNRCPELEVPPGVVVQCPKDGAWGTSCRFACPHPISQLNLLGPSRIKCGDDMTWSGEPPICDAPGFWGPHNRTSCGLPSTPKHARLACGTRGRHDEAGFADGTVCLLTCNTYDDYGELEEEDDDEEEYGRASGRNTIRCRRGLWEGKVPVCGPPPRRRR